MTLPKNRSTRYRKMTRKTPKGTKPVFIRRKSAKASCAVCKEPLAGIRPGSRTDLCHTCSARVIKEASRVREKAKNIEQVDLIYKAYVEKLVK
jgi:ribosomal protein L34E